MSAWKSEKKMAAIRAEYESTEQEERRPRKKDESTDRY